MTIPLTIYKWLYKIDPIHSQMSIQLTIYINDYIAIDYIHSQIAIQVTIYKWLYTIDYIYNWVYT